MKIDDGGILYVDNSILKSVARCSTEAFVRYAHDYASREERATLKMGASAHEATATFLRTGSYGEAMVVYAKLYEEWANANVEPGDRLTYDNTSRILQNWFEMHPVDKLPFVYKPELVEVGFDVPLTDEGDIHLTGRCDAIASDKATGDWVVEDHKFTGQINANFTRNLRMDSQLSGYIWAARQVTDHPVTAAYINAIQMSKLPSDSVRKCKEHATTYEECGILHAKAELIGPIQRSEEQLIEWRKTAIHLAKRYRDLVLKYPDVALIQKVRQQGQFHGACSWCNVYDWCLTGRQLQLLDAVFVKDEWNPLLHSGVIPTGVKP